ncbi:MAG: hypothetical protein WCR52_12835 [Bacteroidota bacterium]
MRYLIFQQGEKPFFTNWFDPENMFVAGLVVVDLQTQKFTDDGVNWIEVEFDTL